MAYVENYDPWVAGSAITDTVLDNLETIYTELSTYITTHAHTGVYDTITNMDATYWNSLNVGHGSGSDADLIYHANGNMHAADFSGQSMPTGIIILWYGATSGIPVGWHLCDGNEGTQDLRDRFVIGAGSEYAVGETGGSNTFTPSGTVTIDPHILTIAQIGSHRHPFLDYYANAGGTASITGIPYHYDSGLVNRTDVTPSAGSGSGHAHSALEGTSMTGVPVTSLPYFKALCYIQKM